MIPQLFAIVVDPRQACDEWLQTADALAELLVAEVGIVQNLPVSFDIVISRGRARQHAACDKAVYREFQHQLYLCVPNI